MSALLPCPFCGSSGEELGMHDRTAGWFASCYVCHVETAFEDSRAEAEAAWNRRAPPPMTSTEEAVYALICREMSQRSIYMDARKLTDAILAFLSLSPLPEGWVAVPREVVDAAETFVHAYRQRYTRPATGGISAAAPMRSEVAALNAALSALPARAGLDGSPPTAPPPPHRMQG